MCLIMFRTMIVCNFFFSSRRRHTRWPRDWSSDVCSSDLAGRRASVDLYATLDDIRYLAGRDPVQTALLPMYWVWLAVADVMTSASPPIALVDEIGRASCRERV